MVLLKSGPYAGKVAVIAEIIDHNRVRPTHTFPLSCAVLINSTGNHRWPINIRPPPILPLPPPDPDPPRADQAAPRRIIRRHQKAPRERGHDRQVEQVLLGAEEGPHREEAVVERL